MDLIFCITSNSRWHSGELVQRSGPHNAKGLIVLQVTRDSAHLTLGERALDRFFEHFAFSVAGAQKSRGKGNE